MRVVRLQNVRSGYFDGRDAAYIDRDHYASLGDHDVRAGDVLIAGLGDGRNLVGRACVAPPGLGDAMVKADCFRFRLNEGLSSAFVALQLSSTAPAVAGLSTGSTRQRINLQAMASRLVALPERSEQAASVRYLDHVGSRIQRLIVAKERLIELLEAEKQAIIHRAITRGTDPAASLRSTGVEWLGPAPERWEVVELRRLGRISGGMTPSMDIAAYWGPGVPWVTPKDMKVSTIADSRDHVTPEALARTGLQTVPAGSVLMVVRGMILARRVPVAVTSGDVTVNQDMKAIIPNERVDGRFLSIALRMAQAALMAMIDEAGHGTRRLPTERWTRLPVPVPELSEQRAILRHIERAAEERDTALDGSRRQIALLREYRTRLISDVVTGKLDVREAAASLPDDPDTDDPGLDEALEEVTA